MLNEHDFASLEAVQARWAEEEAKCRAYLSAVSNEDLARTTHYKNTTGASFSAVTWQLLQHVAMHGMQHRSECAQMLTDFGHSPGNQDMIVFLLAP